MMVPPALPWEVVPYRSVGPLRFGADRDLLSRLGVQPLGAIFGPHGKLEGVTVPPGGLVSFAGLALCGEDPSLADVLSFVDKGLLVGESRIVSPRLGATAMRSQGGWELTLRASRPSSAEISGLVLRRPHARSRCEMA